MSIFFYLGSFFLIVCAFFAGQWVQRNFVPEISVKHALDILKKSLVGLIVFYQANYSDEDQIVLIKKWLDSVDIERVNKAQLYLFKKYMEEL